MVQVKSLGKKALVDVLNSGGEELTRKASNFPVATATVELSVACSQRSASRRGVAETILGDVLQFAISHQSGMF
jgi:hypothetical protein